MKKKKIFCFILPSFFNERKGGSELQSYYIAKELIKRGWEVHYIRENSSKLGNHEEIDGIILHALPRRKDYLRRRNFIWLKKIMDMIKADVWYCRSSISYLEPVVRNARRIGGKVLWACSHDNQLNSVIPKTVNGILSLPLDKYNHLVFVKALRNVDEIILQTRYQQKILEKRYRLQGTLICNAHPIQAYTYNRQRNPIVLWIGRLQPWKHPEIFIDIALGLKKRPYSFIAIGKPMNNGIAKKFRYYDKQLLNFSFLGELSNYEVINYLERAKILVNTSDFEGLSNTFIEAWLKGVPIVSLSVDPDNMIKEHNLGRVSGNIDLMCLDINEMLENKALWHEQSIKTQIFARKTFNIENAVSKLEDLT